jgi:Spy/CpxP family protein refolding chaperone
MVSKYLTSLLICSFILNLSASAQVQQSSVSSKSSVVNTSETISSKSYSDIEWSDLSLTEDQLSKIQELDEEWKRVEQLIRPKIIRDQQQLKNIMSNPHIDEDQIRKLQRDIMLRQEQLRYEATENFLSKRRLLNTKQRETLHKMMSQQ